MEPQKTNAVAGVLIILGALGLLAASLVETSVPEGTYDDPAAAQAYVASHASLVRVGEAFWALGAMGLAAGALTLLRAARGPAALTLPLLAVAGTLLAGQAVMRGVVGVDAAVAGQATLGQVVHALGDAVETVVPVALLGMLGLALTELRDPASALPRWANGLATVVLAVGVASSAAASWAGIEAANAYWPLFFIPLLWLVAYGASLVRGAPGGVPSARPAVAAQER